MHVVRLALQKTFHADNWYYMAIIPLKVKLVWCSHTDRFCWCKWVKSLHLSKSILFVWKTIWYYDSQKFWPSGFNWTLFWFIACISIIKQLSKPSRESAIFQFSKSKPISRGEYIDTKFCSQGNIRFSLDLKTMLITGK